MAGLAMLSAVSKAVVVNVSLTLFRLEDKQISSFASQTAPVFSSSGYKTLYIFLFEFFKTSRSSSCILFSSVLMLSQMSPSSKLQSNSGLCAFFTSCVVD